MGNFHVYLDNGHGGIVNGQYCTPGKRSPKFEDGSQLFEGVYNRAIVRLINQKVSELNDPTISVYNVAPGDIDAPLSNRVKFANDLWVKAGKPNAIYISIHGDANGDGAAWDQASGISVFTSKGQTKSDIFASLLIDKMDDIISGVKWRKDNTDGDVDKEENFYVLRETLMPSVLSENGFMTNKEECTKMLTREWQEKIAQAHFDAILAYRNTLKK